MVYMFGVERALGLLRDDPEILEKAIEYLTDDNLQNTE